MRYVEGTNMIETVKFSRSADQFNRYGEKGIENRINTGEMTPEDADLIREFVSHLQATSNIGEARAYKITNALSNITRFIKTPLMDNSIRDIQVAVSAIKRGEKLRAKNGNNGGMLSQDTQRDYIMFLKRFYLWAVEEGLCDLPVDKIQKIKAPSSKRMTKTPEQMLSEEDIRKMLHICEGVTARRDKALIACLYESAMRIHELAGLKWKDVEFTDHFVRVNVAGKTEIPRYIPLTLSRGYLAEWRSIYPGDTSGNNPVFVTIRNRNLTYQYTKNHLEKIAKRAGIQKHITPHLFRHSRITNMLKAGFSESTIKLMAWGSLSSEQLSRYAHLHNSDVDREVARVNGIEIEEKTDKNILKPKPCSRCLHINEPHAPTCTICGQPLTKEAILELTGMKEEIHGDRRYKSLIDELEVKLAALRSIT